MRKRIGTKIYDTDKAVLVETRDDGIQVYRKTGRSREFFLYNPAGKTAKEIFTDLPYESIKQYLAENTKSMSATNNSNTLRFRPYDLERIRQHAIKLGIPANRFIVMLVDEYEKRQK